MTTHSELHALRSRRPQLSRHNNLTPLRTTLHDKPQHTITSPPNRQPIQQLIPQALALSHRRETPILHLCRIQGHTVLREFEPLLNQRSEFANPSSLLAENFLCVRCPDDDVGDGRCDPNFDTGVAFFGEFALEEFVEFGVEDAVGDKFALFGAGGGGMLVGVG